MKILKTVLIVSIAAFLALALLASPSSAVLGDDDQATNSGVLNLTQKGVTPVTNAEPPYAVDQVVTLQANYPTGHVGNVTFYRQNGGSWEALGAPQATNANGNAYLDYTVKSGSQAIFAEDQNDKETNTKTFTGEVAPPAGTATLNQPTDNGKTWTATFNDTLPSGTKTELQARELCTYETNETDPADGSSIKDTANKYPNCLGPWKTRATGKQDSSGKTTFTMPSRLEVKHKYRAVSGSTESNVVEFAAELPKNPYGIDTGLSEVHFNTYEDDTVDTRSRYFEGEFSMTSSEKSFDPDANGSSAPCSSVAAMPKSVMKGRGNWSWTFPKKSFSLKIDKKTDLCGMGVGKKWALVANDFDKSLMRNTLASYLGQKFKSPGEWAPKAVPVEFYMNGSYRGSYILIERIAIQGSVDDNTYANRVNIHKLKGSQTSPEEITGGYILEWDYRKDADHNVKIDSGTSLDSWIGIKEPENDFQRDGTTPTGDGISQPQIDYIHDYLEEADSALRGSSFTSNTEGWQKYIDKASAVDYYITMEFMKVFDGNMWTSVYMYKPRGEKIHFGPIWDFDLSAGSFTRSVPNLLNTSGWYLRNNQNTEDQQPLGGKTWFNRLNEDPEFREAVADRWNAIKGSVNVGGLIDQQRSLLSQSVSGGSGGSVAANFKKWSYSSRVSPNQLIKGSWSKDVAFLKDWAIKRKNYWDSVCGSGTDC